MINLIFLLFNKFNIIVIILLLLWIILMKISNRLRRNPNETIGGTYNLQNSSINSKVTIIIYTTIFNRGI